MRTILSFPEDLERLSAAWSLDADAYRSRRTLFGPWHVEFRSGVKPPLFEAFTSAPADDRPHLTCRVRDAGDFFRFCCEFPTASFQLGQLLRLQWLSRVRWTGDQSPSAPVTESLMSSDGTRAGKQISARFLADPEPGGWRRSDALLQVVKTAPSDLFHLVIDVPSGVEVDVAGVEVVALGVTERGKAPPEDKSLARARLLRPVIRAHAADDRFADAERLGVVETFRPTRFEGWAVELRRPDEPLTLNVLVDGAPFTQVDTEPGPEPARNGGRFRIDLRAAFTDDQEHEVDIRFADGPSLIGSPSRTRLLDRYQGMADYDPATASITGWAIDILNLDEPLVVEVFADGERLGTTLAARRHPVLAGPRHRRGFCAFQFRLPPRIGRHAEQAIEVRVGGTTTTLPGLTRVRRAGPRFQLRLGEPQADALTGTVLDTLDPGSPVRLRAEFDEETVEEIVADRPASGAFAFRTPVPMKARWLLLRAEDSGEVIADLELRPVEGADADRPADPYEPVVGARSRRPDSARRPAERVQDRPASPSTGASATSVSVFDGLVGVMLRDLSHVDPGRAAGVRDALTASEAEIARRIGQAPLEGEPLISIIMPTFNRAFVIAEAIQSVLEQSWPNWELLVCDDGSTDRTAMVVQSFAEPRIRYLQLEKANGASARNYGLEFARGEFLAFLDSDNVWHPEFLRFSHSILQPQKGVELSYTGFIDTQIVGARYVEALPAFREFDYGALLQRNYIDLNTLFLRRRLYEELGGFDAALPRVQDWDLVLKYVQWAEPLAVRAFPAFYRRNAAWGQVTDLYGHLNINKLVRERAATRLADSQPTLSTALGRPAAFTIIAGPEGDDAIHALSLARVGAAGADLRLVAPNRPGLRRLAADLDLESAVSVVWTDHPGPEHLWGEGVVVVDRRETWPPPWLRGLFAARLVRRCDRFDLQLAEDYVAMIGGLPPTDLEAFQVTEASELGDGLRTVIVDVGAASAWRAALTERQHSTPVLLIAIGDLGDVSALTWHAGREEAVSTEQALGLLRYRTEAAILLTEREESAEQAAVQLAPLAMAGGGLLVIGASGPLATLADEGVALSIGTRDPSQVLDTLEALVADLEVAPAIRAAALARHQRLHRADRVAERLRQVVSRWLNVAEEAEA